MRKSTWRARLSGVLAAVFLVGLLPTVTLAADNDPITRAGLAEKIYTNDSLKMLIVDDTTEAGFNDIDNCTEDQKNAINALANAGIISGTSADTFSPSKTVTRAEVAVVLWRATGCKSNETASTVVFDDVHIGDWYAPAIQALSAAGIITGTQDEKFNPTETITEQQVSTLISRYASSGMNRWQTGTTRLEMLMETYEKYKDSPVLQAKAEAGSEIDYADISDCTPEQKTAIQFFTKAGIVQGYNETPAAFHPYAAASSVQIAVFLMNCARASGAASRSVTSLSNLMPLAASDTATQAFDFLEAQGLTISDGVKDNPNAPGLTTNLSAWADAVAPEKPTFSPASQAFTGTLSAIISAGEHTGSDGTKIYYTTDGTGPTTSGTLYNGAISITATTTIKAIAVKNNLVSEEASATYTLQGSTVVLTPDPTPDMGDSSGDSEPSYAPSINAGSGGTVRTSPRTPSAGDTVILTVTPNPGYELSELIVTSRSGAVGVTDNGDGTHTYQQPAGRVTITVRFREEAGPRPFADVPEDYWANDAIRWAMESGYMSGTLESIFTPEGAVTRQQVWMILARFSGSSPADMAQAAAWAMESGISDGTTPGGAVSRQQLAAMLYRYAQNQGQGFTGAWTFPLDYPDAEAVSEYAYEPLCWMTMNGIITGTTQGMLNPRDGATRAQFAVMLQRFAQALG